MTNFTIKGIEAKLILKILHIWENQTNEHINWYYETLDKKEWNDNQSGNAWNNENLEQEN